MPRLSKSVPKYRKHRASGQAIVTLGGLDHYLGPWRTKASLTEYDRLIGEWLANGRSSPKQASGLLVSGLLVAYKRWAQRYYQASNEFEHVTYALRPLRELYGRTEVSEFGPIALRAIREKMITDGLSRSGVNKRIERIRRVFRWGVEHQLVEPSVFQSLQAVRGLGRGRSEARETEPVKPVPDAFVDALEGKVLPQVWTMIQLQRLTAMRPGEVTRMRTCDIDTSGKVWIYSPAMHKNAYRGHGRKIYVGPRGQAVLGPWLKTSLEEYLFSPAEAMETLRAERERKRKTKVFYGNRRGSHRVADPQKVPGECYSVESYRKAIKSGCKAADVPLWSPHRLRHSSATWLRKEFGIDVARVILGHRSPAVTEIYAAVDTEKAIKTMEAIG